MLAHDIFWSLPILVSREGGRCVVMELYAVFMLKRLVI